MNILKRTLAGLLVVYLAFGQVTVIPGDWVQGFSSLTTAGSNVYVTGVGTIGQDTSFTRSAAGRYTLYDATASTGVTTLTVRGGSAQGGTGLQQWLASAGTVGATMYESGDFELLRGFTSRYSANTGIGLRVFNSSTTQYFNVGYLDNLRVGLGSTATIGWTNGTSAYAAADTGLSRSSANNLAITNGGATTYWTLGAAGIQCGSGDGNSAACDVGTSGARVRDVNAAGTVTAGTNSFAGNGFYLAGGGDWSIASTAMKLRSDSTIGFANGTNATGTIDTIIRRGGAAGMLVIGDGSAAASSSYPALKRFGNAVAVRAADDTISTFATLTACSASGEGALASISDSATAVWGLVVTGGGSNHILAYCNGTDWTVAAK